MTQSRPLANDIDALLGNFERTTDPARAAHIIQITGAPGGTLHLYRGCHRVSTRNDGADLLPKLIAVLNRLAIEELRELAVHAAVVAVDRRIIAFPADSGGGKTTLAAAAILAGFSYISDEALVLDDDGRVLPYPKPMALSPWSCETLGLDATAVERLYSPAELGGEARLEPGELTDLVVPAYGAGRPGITRLAASQAVFQLIAKSFNHYKDPERAFRLATEVARRANVWQLQYGHPRTAVELLLEHLRQSTTESPTTTR